METARRLKRYILIFTALLFSNMANAQSEETGMADTMRSDGKIYVVVTILSIVMAVLLIYLVVIDSKVNKLEEKMKNKGK